jgi:ferric-dicitrate binding protein FerR (iron transport regulator)
MPGDWAGTTLVYRWSDAGTHYHVTYHAASGTQGGYALADGQRHELDAAGAILLDVRDDGARHQVDFFLSVMV